MNKPRKSSTKTQATGSIRIIAGKHRGRKLPVIMANGLRPTTDRVKETVFNWLMPYIQDSKCLDCFAGSGSLGFEALSRGAKQVDFVELNKNAAQQIKNNIKQLKADNAFLHQQDALNYLSHNQQPCDLVFIDPPFRQDMIEQCLNLLNQGWLSADALIYIEMEKELNSLAVPANWQLLKSKKAGQVHYCLYQNQG